MRRLVKERLNEEDFTRGGDPYRKMGIGSYASKGFQNGDRIQLLEHVYHIFSDLTNGTYLTESEYKSRLGRMFQKGDILTYDGVGYDEGEEADFGEFWDEKGDMLEAEWINKHKSAFKMM